MTQRRKEKSGGSGDGGMAPGSELADEDSALFRDAVRGATPIRALQRKQHAAKPPPPPVPVHSLLDTYAALSESIEGPIPWDESMDTGEELNYLRDGFPRDMLRKLRRGHWVIQDALDLHGFTKEQARVLLSEFLAVCRRRRLRCVRIIHGKGLGSPNREPVLRGMVKIWLARQQDVLAYSQAPEHFGGSGATLVLLKG
jgi:DNA-nicking Smr family endonuclease